MTVKELIEKLGDYPSDALVVVEGRNDCLETATKAEAVEVVKSIGLMTGAEYYHRAGGVSALARDRMARATVIVVRT